MDIVDPPFKITGRFGRVNSIYLPLRVTSCISVASPALAINTSVQHQYFQTDLYSL